MRPVRSLRLDRLVAAWAAGWRNHGHSATGRGRLFDLGIDVLRRANHAARTGKLVTEIAGCVLLPGLELPALPDRGLRVWLRTGVWIDPRIWLTWALTGALVVGGAWARARAGNRTDATITTGRTKRIIARPSFAACERKDNGLPGRRVPLSQCRWAPAARIGSAKNGRAAASAGARSPAHRHGGLAQPARRAKRNSGRQPSLRASGAKQTSNTRRGPASAPM